MFNIVFNTTFPTATGFLTGMFLLLYGVWLLSHALEQAISGHMRQVLTRMPRNSLAAFGIGVVSTVLIPSSSAMASLLVEPVSVGLLPLSVTIVMVLGANVGSTLVVQLLALHITNHAVELLGLGVAVALFTHFSPVLRRPGCALFAFGLVVLGLAIIEKASQPLASMASVLAVLSGAPIVLLVIGAVLAMLLNSCITSMGLVITLVTLPAQGALQVQTALVLMLGVNVGTTLLALLVSLREGTLTGCRLALLHSGTKLFGALVLLIPIGYLATLLNRIWPHDPGMQVAQAYMGFNLMLALIFVPLSDILASLIERLVPKKSYSTVEACYPCVLDPQALTTPDVAQGLATRETLRMADIVTDMFELSMRAFEGQSDVVQKRIEAIDDQVDELNTAIKSYLAQLDEEEMNDKQRRLDIALLMIVSGLEAIGDVITHRFMNLARRQSRGQVLFSEEGWEDLLHYHKQIKENLQHVIAALAAHDPVLVTQCLARKRELKRLKRNLHQRHIRELRAGVRTGIVNSTTSSAIYLDLLDALSAVLSHISNMAYVLQEASNPQSTKPLLSPGTGQFKAMNTQQLCSVSPGNLEKDTSYLSSN